MSAAAERMREILSLVAHQANYSRQSPRKRAAVAIVTVIIYKVIAWRQGMFKHVFYGAAGVDLAS